MKNKEKLNTEKINEFLKDWWMSGSEYDEFKKQINDWVKDEMPNRMGSDLPINHYSKHYDNGKS